MNSVQIEENVKSLVKQVSSQKISKDDFVYELLLAYGHRKSVVNRVKSGERNLAKDAGEVILKRHLYFKPCTSNLFAEIDALKNSKTVATNKIRFVVITDFYQLIAIDTKTQDTLDIELGQLPKHFDFFLPWAGMEKMVYRGENPADVKAAEKMADFFDHIKVTNYPANATKEQLHDLVVFLNRLLFCFFAEDTKIFSENQFTNLLNQHTQEDGAELNGVFERLFNVLNTPAHQRNDLPKYLNNFPYVNGGLFKRQIRVPSFDAKARRMLLDSGQLDWADINPDIFGSMIQGVAAPETRSKMGMHYTSVSNIMKVIEPLFLNDLYEEFDKCNDSINKLKKLQVRLSRIKFFDPACGSGNFLIIAYKEIRLLEIEIIKRIRELEGKSDSGALGLFDESHSSIRLDQFYGIELDDFAHEMAILSLWLVEHQMNMVFETEFGYTAPTLPLKQSGRIVADNAALIDWEVVCPISNEDETYILGNPPYLGARQQSKDQKAEIKKVFSGVKGAQNLDYIAIWFLKACIYSKDKLNVKSAFVSTNSIVQGVQVATLWPLIFKSKLDIFFCHTSFKWSNNAKRQAGVTCVIIGLAKPSSNPKYIFDNFNKVKAKNINAYLTDGDNVFVEQRRKSLSKLPPINYGSFALDDGNYTLTPDEANSILESDFSSSRYIREFVGSKELIQGNSRYCIWIEDDGYKSNFEISKRVALVQKWRSESDRLATVKLAGTPEIFAEKRQPKTTYLAFPTISSERRPYIPIKFYEPSTIASNQVYVVSDAELWLFAILTSSMHMTWIKSIGGKLETRYRYSAALCYNTFPIGPISENLKVQLEECALEILSIQESYPDQTLAYLYDPDTMPEELRNAHKHLDSIVENLYSKSILNSDEERLKVLLNLYCEMIKVEKNA
ncbi:class I SAM-dependent DNA methyltransferase [Lelliottia nimipressuralis]|uniref:site-specific DNA-methyltransferase (adenine-specific) n=1 Tax=Lelliottia nimipressuralis TaxID=69220 RepID=A0ABD4K560_9ENTR|nr:class I SAM-dependent DNA methyltransferase [Lelliottia nimipressuralis]MBF4176523.1 class I SAM-dependent DNA methyltransferase [Lelliottia nimipressuralis]